MDNGAVVRRPTVSKTVDRRWWDVEQMVRALIKMHGCNRSEQQRFILRESIGAKKRSMLGLPTNIPTCSHVLRVESITLFTQPLQDCELPEASVSIMVVR